MWALRGAMFLILLGCGIYWVYAGNWMKENGIGETVIGILGGIAGAVSAGMGLFWGWLSDRTAHCTPIVAGGCLLTALSLVVLAFSRQLTGFAVAQFLSASGLSATLSLMPVLVLAVLGGKSVGGGYGRFRLFGSIGYVAGLYVLASRVRGLDTLFLVASLALGLAVVPLFWARVQPRRHVERHGFAVFAREPRLVAFLIAVFLLGLGGPATFTFLSLYAREIGMNQAEIARLMGVCGLVAMFGLPLSGIISDRIGTRPVLAITFLAMPVRLLMQATAAGSGGLYAAQLLHFFTWAGLEVTMYIYVTQITGDQDKGVAVSAVVTTRTLSGVLGSPLCGWLAEHLGYRAMFVVMALTGALSFAAFLGMDALAGRLFGLMRCPASPQSASTAAE